MTQPDERIRIAPQVFIPLSVSSYVVPVTPSDGAGEPVAAQALAMLVPGTIGVIFHPGIWHAGAVVLDTAGSFAVLMCRSGGPSDDEFCTVAQVTLDVADTDAKPRPQLHAGVFAR